jgi:hypothetical protein
MNLAASLVESYMYADVFNREYDGGSNLQDKFTVGGVPVETILPYIGARDDDSQSDNKQEGGESNSQGPFANKIVPVGLVMIPIQKCQDIVYEDHIHPGADRKVVPDSLFDLLLGSVQSSTKTHRNRTPTKRRAVKDRSRKKRK